MQQIETERYEYLLGTSLESFLVYSINYEGNLVHYQCKAVRKVVR